jgi:hypothetical protein
MANHTVESRADIFTHEALAKIGDLERKVMGRSGVPFTSILLYREKRFVQTDMEGGWGTRGSAHFSRYRDDGQYYAAGMPLRWGDSRYQPALMPLVFAWIKAIQQSVSRDIYDKMRLAKCNQVGCSRDATFFYYVNHLNSVVCHHVGSCLSAAECSYNTPTRDIRVFCDQHAYRGTCGFGDIDGSYMRIDPCGVPWPLDAEPKVPPPDPYAIYKANVMAEWAD